MLGLVEGDLEKQDELGIAVAKYMRALEYYNESTAKVLSLFPSDFVLSSS
jgi:hypothetical protein